MNEWATDRPTAGRTYEWKNEWFNEEIHEWINKNKITQPVNFIQNWMVKIPPQQTFLIFLVFFTLVCK